MTVSREIVAVPDAATEGDIPQRADLASGWVARTLPALLDGLAGSAGAGAANGDILQRLSGVWKRVPVPEGVVCSISGSFAVAGSDIPVFGAFSYEPAGFIMIGSYNDANTTIVLAFHERGGTSNHLNWNAAGTGTISGASLAHQGASRVWYVGHGGAADGSDFSKSGLTITRAGGAGAVTLTATIIAFGYGK